MDEVRVGNTLRTMRTRRGLRQSDVARNAGVPRNLVSMLERGGFSRVRFDSFLAVAASLGIRADVRLRWQGGDLDRVMNAAHASLHEALANHLDELPGWTHEPEVSFSIYGERGIIDILAWHAASSSLLIIELKTALVDPQDLVATMHRRVRLGPAIAREQGWDPRNISAWVVLADSRTNRRRVKAHAGLLRPRFPSDGHAMRSWLRRPNGRISALSFWTDARSAGTKHPPGQPTRVRSATQGRRGASRERG